MDPLKSHYTPPSKLCFTPVPYTEHFCAYLMYGITKINGTAFSFFPQGFILSNKTHILKILIIFMIPFEVGRISWIELRN